jgi:NADH-quinone oxidoreductase subunit A
MEFFFLLNFILITLILGIVLFSLSFFLVPKLTDNEKTSSYESGFSPFSSTRNIFQVSFYLVALLFLVFDLEVGLLFPFSVIAGNLPGSSFFIAFFFILILTVGLVYELLNQALTMLIGNTKDN